MTILPIMNIRLHNPRTIWHWLRPTMTTGFIVRDFSNAGNGDDSKWTNIHDVGKRLLECYRVLDIAQTCSKEELKSRYLELAKRYHPDTGGSSADVAKFRRLHSAYKFIVDNDYGAADRQELENVPKVFDIRHTAPQHRQYLEYGGVGHGTPSQRLRQYQQHRVQQASENVKDYMVNKLLANEQDYSLITKTVEEREYARKWKTRSAVDRLVEDLIQESMRRGEFANLSGAGKPLAYESHNPYVDSMTHKLNQVLIQNGFCPEWVLMEKEIRTEISRIRVALRDARKKVDEDSYYLHRHDERERLWRDSVARLRDDCSALNKRIDNFNLLVPSLHKQMVHFSMDKELKKLSCDTVAADASSTAKTSSESGETKQPIEEPKERPPDTPVAFSEPKADRENESSQRQEEKQLGVFRMLLHALIHEKVH